MPERALPPKLADFPHHMTDNIRFGDIDSQGHVNNVIFARFVEVRASRHFARSRAWICSARCRLRPAARRDRLSRGNAVSRSGHHRHAVQARRHHVIDNGTCIVRRIDLHRHRRIDHGSGRRQDTTSKTISARCRGQTACRIAREKLITATEFQSFRGALSSEPGIQFYAVFTFLNSRSPLTRRRGWRDLHACRSGVVTTRPSSSGVTLIWHDSRELGRTS